MPRDFRSSSTPSPASLATLAQFRQGTISETESDRFVSYFDLSGENPFVLEWQADTDKVWLFHKNPANEESGWDSWEDPVLLVEPEPATQDMDGEDIEPRVMFGVIAADDVYGSKETGLIYFTLGYATHNWLIGCFIDITERRLKDTDE
jgi:hypothetical protein